MQFKNIQKNGVRTLRETAGKQSVQFRIGSQLVSRTSSKHDNFLNIPSNKIPEELYIK